MKPIVMLLLIFTVGCTSPRDRFIDSLDTFNDRIEQAHAACQRGDCRQLDRLSQSIERAGPLPLEPYQAPEWSIYVTPYGNLINHGDGLIADPKGNMYVPY